MFRKTVFKALAMLMMTVTALGSFVSCEGANASVPPEGEVMVTASVNDETKSLEAYFGDTVANDVTHYRWILTHRNPTRIYDTGYVERSVAEAGHLYANMHGTNHKILTGEYDWKFYAYVNDGTGSADSNYHVVSKIEDGHSLVNAKTSSISITLDTLTGRNAGTEIVAVIPVDFYRSFVADSSSLTVTATAVDAVTGSATDFSTAPAVTDGGTNRLNISLGTIPTGSYKLTVVINNTEAQDTKTAVTVLRSVTDSIAKGEMNFASTSLTLSALGVTLVDKTGNIIDVDASMDNFNMVGLDADYRNSTAAYITLRYPHTDGMSIVWHIDGTEVGTDKIEVCPREGSQEADVEKFEIKAGAIEEGDHILTAVLIDSATQMSAGSVSYNVTVSETALLPKGGMDTFRGKTYSYTNDEGEQRFVFFSKDLITAGKWKMVEGPVTPADGADSDTLIDEIASQIATYGFTSPGHDLMIGGYLIANGWDEANKELHLYNLNGGMTLKLMETVPQSVQLQIAALGGDSTFGTATIAKNDVFGYFEQCDSTGNALDPSGQVMWFWLNDPEGAGECHVGKGVLVGGTNIAQYAFLGGGWWFAGSDNILTAEYGSFFPGSSTIAGSIDSQYIVTPMDESGDFYKIEIAYSANTSGSMVGMTIYLKRTTMNQSVQTYLSGKSHVVL